MTSEQTQMLANGLAIPSAKVTARVNGREIKMAISTDTSDPEEIKKRVIQSCMVSNTKPGRPAPVVEIVGEPEFTNPDGTPFNPENIRGLNMKR